MRPLDKFEFKTPGRMSCRRRRRLNWFLTHTAEKIKQKGWRVGGGRCNWNSRGNKYFGKSLLSQNLPISSLKAVKASSQKELIWSQNSVMLEELEKSQLILKPEKEGKIDEKKQYFILFHVSSVNIETNMLLRKLLRKSLLSLKAFFLLLFVV
jgi:hypothetical protein